MARVSAVTVGEGVYRRDRNFIAVRRWTCVTTAGFMVRKGRWKFHYYVRFRPELFDLDTDPEELCDLASDPRHAAVLREMEAELRRICDPEAVDALAKSDQRAMIERLGGVQAAARMGAGGATPVPKETSDRSTPPRAAKAA